MLSRAPITVSFAQWCSIKDTLPPWTVARDTFFDVTYKSFKDQKSFDKFVAKNCEGLLAHWRVVRG